MAFAFQQQACSICELKHLTSDAEEWCPECDEYLCMNCKNYHKLAKSSKRHKTVRVSDLKELPSLVFAIKIKCAEHHENYEYFCSKHEIPICVICAEEHTSCGTFTILRKLEGTKTSPSMIKLEQNVRDIQQNIEIFLQNRHIYLSNLQKQREDCMEKVKEIRLKIDRHLDKLEKTANVEIDTTYTNHKSEVEHTVDDLSGRKIKMDTFKNDIEKIKDHASDIQTFLSIQDIQKDVTEEENHLVLIGQDRLQEIELSFTSASSCVSGIILESLGKLKTNIKPSDISFVRKDDSEAQLILPESNEKDINLISLAKRLDFTLPTNLGKAKFESCFCMDNGLILLADRGQKFRIIVFASNGALVCEIPLQQNPNDVVYINQSIYVSSFSSMTLTSIDFKTKQMKKRIDTGYKCDALAVAGDKILLRLSKFEYKIYDQNLVEVGKIPLLTTHAPHVSYFEERIYISLWKENKVNCYNMTGNLIWQFQHEYIRGPYGTAIDNYGNLFVCGFYSNSISVISPNGKNCRILLNLTDVLAHPTSIYYNHVSKQLIVSSNECNKILVYGVS